MSQASLPLDQIITGDCVEALARLPERSVDLIFADPPYNLQLRQALWRPNMTRIDAVDDERDRFATSATAPGSWCVPVRHRSGRWSFSPRCDEPWPISEDGMPAPKRQRVEPTEEWEQVRLLAASPPQTAYELLRPIVLFGATPAQRARETGVPERTLRRQADRFDTLGMASLFDAPARPAAGDRRALPAEIRQAIVDLKAEYPPLRPNELATICAHRFHRPVSHHTVTQVLGAGLTPTVTTRRFPRYRDIADPVERRLAVVRLYHDA